MCIFAVSFNRAGGKDGKGKELLISSSGDALSSILDHGFLWVMYQPNASNRILDVFLHQYISPEIALAHLILVSYSTHGVGVVFRAGVLF